MNNMNPHAAHMTIDQIISEVLEMEKTGCQDRARLTALNMRARQLEGKTVSTILIERGL